MKRKSAVAAVLAAAILLGGCAEKRENPANSPESGENSAQSSYTTQPETSSQQSSTPQSSKSGAPNLVAPGFNGSSLPAQEPIDDPESSEEVSEIQIDVPNPPAESIDPPTSYTYTELDPDKISSEGEFHIKSGEVYSVSNELVIVSNSQLIIENGGRLCISGLVKCDGDIVVLNGGKMELTDNNAFVGGDGRLVIEGSFDDIDCTYGTVQMNVTPPERVVENGVTTVGGVVIANKAIKLPPEYGSELSDGEIKSEVYSALMEMNEHSAHYYSIVSAYRSYYSQERIFKGWCDVYGFEEASTISSQAGHSEHQTGLTMDLDSLETSYGGTAEGIWLAENCYKYGFIIRYPKGKDDITGYAYEPWHVRYLGKSTAKLVYSSGLTLEEFLNVEGGKVVID